MKILITGGAGYIGTELVNHLSDQINISKIVIYDNFSRGNFGLFLQNNKISNKRISVIKGDILNTRKLKKSLMDINIVIHLASKASSKFENEEHHPFDQINNWGTAELVYLIEELGITKLISFSSSNVYGLTNVKKEFSEDNPLNPASSFAFSKMRAEEHVKRLFINKNINSYIFRIGNVFGFSQSMRLDEVVNKFIFEAKYFGKIYINGNGEQIHSFIDIKDVVKIIDYFIKNDIENNVYNIFAENVSISTIGEIVKEIFPNIDIQYLNQHLTHGSTALKMNPIIQNIIKPEKNYIKNQISNIDKFSL